MIPEDAWPLGILLWQRSAAELEAHLASTFTEADALLSQICSQLEQVPLLDFAQSHISSVQTFPQFTMHEAISDARYRVYFKVHRQGKHLTLSYAHTCHGDDTVKHCSVMSREFCIALHILARHRHLQIRCMGLQNEGRYRDQIEVTLGLNKP